MELATRVFDVVTDKENIYPAIRELLPEITNEVKKMYWRRVLRMAALCHDIGHLPFSHAAEEDLLPPGWNHERFTRELIESHEMQSIWNKLTPPLRPEDIVKLAVGPRKAPDLKFTDWEAILAEIIVGDSFGVDRMDYLLRDSYYTGVAYGKFDHYRLIDTLKILPPPGIDNDAYQEGSIEPSLGVEVGGLQSAEALLLARYFMFTQVYLHRVRRIYDIHLKDFLCTWLPGNKFSTDLETHLSLTDNEIIAAISHVSREPNHAGHKHARRFINRNHFKLLYERNPGDIEKNPEAVIFIYKETIKKFGPGNVRRDSYKKRSGESYFPVLAMDGRIISSESLSVALRNMPESNVDCVFVESSILNDARHWLKKKLNDIIAMNKED